MRERKRKKTKTKTKGKKTHHSLSSSSSSLLKTPPTTTTTTIKPKGVINTTSVGRSPHEASWTPSGEEVWVAVRGEDFVEILDGRPPFASLNQKFRVPPGPGMVAFSPDGSLAFVCSSFTPETVVIDAKTKETVASIEQNSTFCPNLAVTPDGTQLWLTLKDSGRTQVVEAREPFRTLAVIETGEREF